MSGSRGARQRKAAARMVAVHPNAAGIDVGSKTHYVAVPEDRAEANVRHFGCVTAELHRLGDWLEKCGVDTVAMESTGVYWIPLFQILETRGFEVLLVNARHVKNVPGRKKTDVLDCRWIQRLHTFGLLAGSFRPNDAVCVLRSYVRQRQSLVESSTTHIQRMQKALEQMNVQLHKFITDITGKTGLRIIDAILAGERDPQKLASLKVGNTKHSRDEIAAALTGDYRDEHVFVLGQELELYRTYQLQIARCEEEIERSMATFDDQVDISDKPLSAGTQYQKQYSSLREHLYRMAGVDFTRIPGLSALNVQTILSEVGLDMSRWPTSKHFCSWLALTPNNKKTGGRVQSRRTRPGTNRAAQAFRMAAFSVTRSKSALGAFYRRKRAQKGAPVALTATAHKIAHLFYTLAVTGHEYTDPGLDYYERKYRQRLIKGITKRAAELGYSIVQSKQAVPDSVS